MKSSTGSSSNSSTSTNNISKDSLNNPREYYFYDSSNSSGTPSLPSGYFDGDEDDSLSSITGFTNASNEFKSIPIQNNLITEMSKFNTKMNELYVFFKGKIKPNLKTISKQEIQDILKDMSQLNYNFTDVLHAIEDLNIFGLEKDSNIFGLEKDSKHKKLLKKDLKLKHPKIDAFKQTFETNFKKSSADIINNVKAYSSLGQYSTSSLPDDMLFNSKFPTFDGKGLTLVPDSVRKNMHHSRKYLQ
jgi:hypothetical protein